MTDLLRGHVAGWITKADNDLISASRLIEIEPMILDNACFFCQQACEKYLKAFLTFRSHDFERTHNLFYLLQECSQYDMGFASIEVRDLSAFAVQVRYPDSSISPTLEEAREYFQIARSIGEFVKKRLK